MLRERVHQLYAVHAVENLVHLYVGSLPHWVSASCSIHGHGM